MPIDYNLEIESQLSPKELLEIIIQSGNFKCRDKVFFYTDGLVGLVSKNFEQSRQIIQEYFNFQPTLTVNFSPDQSAEDEVYYEAMHKGLKTFMDILKHEAGDAVCLMEGESVVFTRISGKLIVNLNKFYEADAVWTFDQIPFPYETKEFEILN